MALYPITHVIKSLHEIGVALHGERYQLALSRDLSDVTGRHVTAVQIGRWTMGTRQGPEWLPTAVIDLAHRGIDDLAHRQDLIRAELESLYAGGHPTADLPTPDSP